MARLRQVCSPCGGQGLDAPSRSVIPAARAWSSNPPRRLPDSASASGLGRRQNGTSAAISQEKLLEGIHKNRDVPLCPNRGVSDAAAQRLRWPPVSALRKGNPPYPPRTMVEVQRLFDDDIVEIDSVFYAPSRQLGVLGRPHQTAAQLNWRARRDSNP